MKTIAVISRKGGAGKTTIALHLAAALEAGGMSVAVFDLDPQASASIWGDRRQGEGPAVVAAQAPRLPALLDQARRQEADVVILDTAPHADSIASDSAAQADAILIPCQPSTFDLDAIGASVKLAKASGKPFFVVINAAPSQGEETEQMRATLVEAGVNVAPAVLHYRKAFKSYIQEGRTAQEAEPKGKAAMEIRELAQWVCEEVIELPSNKATKSPKKKAAA